jgi:hypothetical protein
MQAGKGVSRGRRGLRRATVGLAAAAVLTAAVRPALSEPGNPALRFAFSEWGIPAGRIGLLRDDAHGWRAGVFSGMANPYLIEGLTDSNLLVGLGCRPLSIWLDWNRLAQRLYREDHVSASLGFGLPLEGLRGVAVAAAERRRVTGFAAQRVHSLRLSASYEYRRSIWVALRGSVYESEACGPGHTVLSFGIRSTSLALEVDRSIAGMMDRGSRFLVEVRLHESCSLLSAYLTETEEISTGLLIELSSVLWCFVWSQHPALESTLAVEVGRMWKW